MRMVAIVLLGTVLTRPVASAAQTTSADSAVIVRLEGEMNELLQRRAIDEYARHLAPDYARTTQRGRLESREQALAAWRAAGPGRHITPTQLWVRVYGDAAVLTGLLVGSDGGPQTRITKTFVRINGRWMLAALHGTGVDSTTVPSR